MIKMQTNLNVNVGNVIAGSKEEIKKQKQLQYLKTWRKENKEKNRQYQKTWYAKNKALHMIHCKIKYNNDPNYKLKQVLRQRLRHALKNKIKSQTTLNLLGCTVVELWNHLEKQFKKGMTRENHGEWHIDHIKPCSAFDLNQPEEQQKCFHYTNLQPLWSKENLTKSNKYDQ